MFVVSSVSRETKSWLGWDMTINLHHKLNMLVICAALKLTTPNMTLNADYKMFFIWFWCQRFTIQSGTQESKNWMPININIGQKDCFDQRETWNKYILVLWFIFIIVPLNKWLKLYGNLSHLTFFPMAMRSSLKTPFSQLCLDESHKAACWNDNDSQMSTLGLHYLSAAHFILLSKLAH